MEKLKKIIFFDIDKTLVDENYNYEDGLFVIEELKNQRFEIILNSSKTRAEQEYYRKIFNLNTPFIVENGSAVYIPTGYFNNLNLPQRDSYDVMELGIPYKTIVEHLSTIEKEFGLKYYANSTLEEVKKFLGMTEELARLAMMREYSETIFKYKKTGFEEILKNHGLTCQMGSRFIAVLGDTNKGKGMDALLNFYRKEFSEIEVYAAGDGSNDFPMFERAGKFFLLGEKNYPGAIKISGIRELLNFI